MWWNKAKESKCEALQERVASLERKLADKEREKRNDRRISKGLSFGISGMLFTVGEAVNYYSKDNPTFIQVESGEESFYRYTSTAELKELIKYLQTKVKELEKDKRTEVL